MYKTNTHKPKKLDFDVIVIGSGAGGAVAAHLAASDGKKVGLIESSQIGGKGTITGSIATKALLQSAIALDNVLTANKFGIRASGVSYNYRSIQAWKDKVVSATGINDEFKAFKSEGIVLIKGNAQILDRWTVNVGLRRYTTNNFLIATGSRPNVPKIPGLMATGFITNREATHLLRLPKSILIIGGGGIAYEFSQIFAAFGTRVHIIEQKNHILPNTDYEVGDIAEYLLENKGIKVLTSSKIINISSIQGKKITTFIQHDQQHRIATEEILVASGICPNTDLGLENIGVQYDASGIEVNRFMRTNIKNIFASGDVLGKNISTQAAIQEGRIAIHNMFHKKQVSLNYHAIPQCYYGKPEITIIGVNENELKNKGLPYQTAIAQIGILGKSITSNYSSGFVKIIASHSGIVLGASVVAPEASEISQELTFAIQHHHHACDLANTLHPFPSWNEAIRVAANKIKCS